MTKLLKGSIGQGMFSDENMVQAQDYEGTPVIFIVHKSAIERVESDKCFLQVQVVDSKDGRTVIVLPGEVLNGPGPMITVRDSELVAMADNPAYWRLLMG